MNFSFCCVSPYCVSGFINIFFLPSCICVFVDVDVVVQSFVLICIQTIRYGLWKVFAIFHFHSVADAKWKTHGLIVSLLIELFGEFHVKYVKKEC